MNSQCAKRRLECKYPHTSRRGQRKPPDSAAITPLLPPLANRGQRGRHLRGLLRHSAGSELAWDCPELRIMEWPQTASIPLVRFSTFFPRFLCILYWRSLFELDFLHFPLRRDTLVYIHVKTACARVTYFVFYIFFPVVVSVKLDAMLRSHADTIESRRYLQISLVAPSDFILDFIDGLVMEQNASSNTTYFGHAERFERASMKDFSMTLPVRTKRWWNAVRR
ncbi:hypothetical protein EDB84DRAFT_977952 [Lactarius hengduanensis]|nr:hypothetical protein EDB84DRAFT_977952 [Lactarius hengduanensis]